MKTKAKTRYIVRNPEIMGGAPVIAGTRIPVIRLVWLMRHGYTEQQLREDFPYVSRTKLRGALAELFEHTVHQLEQEEYGRSPSKTSATAR